MKKQLIIAFAVFSFALRLPGQEGFVPGTLLLETGREIQGLIKPERFEKGAASVQIIPESGIRQKYGIEEARSITLRWQDGREERFIKTVAAVNRSPWQTEKLGREMEPQMHRDTLVLMALVSGGALNLYVDERIGRPRFFIAKEEGEVQELLLHRYRHPAGEVAEVPEYRKQLVERMADCNSISIAKLNELKYNQPALMKVVESYNECKRSGELFIYKEPSGRLHFGFGAGANLSKVNFSGYTAINRITEAEFGWAWGYQAGIALDYRLARNSDKLTLTNELWYRRYGGDGVQQDANAGNLSQSRTIAIDLAYLNWNLLVKYRQPEKQNALVLLGGATQGWVLNDDSRVLVSRQQAGETVVSEEPFLENGPVDVLKRYNQGLMAGVGYRARNLEGTLRFELNNGLERMGNVKSSSTSVHLMVNYFLVE